MRRRVRFRLTGPEDASPCLDWVWICKDFTEVDSGIWLPRRCYRLDYAAQDEPPSVRGHLKAVNELGVKSIAVNDVDDSVFNLEFPAGTDVTDLIRNKDYVVPHGEERTR